MAVPTPLKDNTQLHSFIGIPWYIDFALLTKNGWAYSYYFGLVVSKKSLATLWAQSLSSIFISHISIHFGSSVFNERLIISDEECLNHSFDRKSKSEKYEKKFLEILASELKKKHWPYNFYNQAMFLLGFMAKYSLFLFILSITYNQKGVLNVGFILLCFFGIVNNTAKLVNNNAYLLKHKYISAIFILKWYFYFYLACQVAYQYPGKNLHKDEGNRKSTSKIIGLIHFWPAGKRNYDISYENFAYIVWILVATVLTILFDHFRKSDEYYGWMKHSLSLYLKLSESKARCMTYLYNNNKLWDLGLNRYKKGIINNSVAIISNNIDDWIQQHYDSLSRKNQKEMSEADSEDEYPTLVKKIHPSEEDSSTSLHRRGQRESDRKYDSNHDGNLNSQAGTNFALSYVEEEENVLKMAKGADHVIISQQSRFDRDASENEEPLKVTMSNFTRFKRYLKNNF